MSVNPEIDFLQRRLLLYWQWHISLEFIMDNMYLFIRVLFEFCQCLGELCKCDKK